MKSVNPHPERTKHEQFELFYINTRIEMLGYLMRRTNNTNDAAELLAEVYLTAWRRVEDIPADDQARLWLYGVGRRVLTNYRRHGYVEQRLAERLRARIATKLSLQQPHQDSLLAEATAACIARLSDGDREVIQLSAFEQMSTGEIAAVTGTTDGAVRVRLHRTRKTLRKDLAQLGFVELNNPIAAT